MPRSQSRPQPFPPQPPSSPVQSQPPHFGPQPLAGYGAISSSALAADVASNRKPWSGDGCGGRQQGIARQGTKAARLAGRQHDGHAAGRELGDLRWSMGEWRWAMDDSGVLYANELDFGGGRYAKAKHGRTTRRLRWQRP
nr:uncharacterized protein LOC122321529 [Drosophila bipectinata]